jgi:hypothetical protein
MKKNTIKVITLQKKIFFSSVLSASLVLQSCGGDGSPRLKDSQEQTIMESSKGVITEVEEIEPGDDYKILDEKIIDSKEKSLAIVHRLDGTTDTLLLQKLKEEAKSSRHSSLSNVLMYSLAASYFTRNLGNTTPNASFYKDASAHSKSTGLKNDLTKTATSRRVSVPGKSSTGYGSGKSFRSYGG